MPFPFPPPQLCNAAAANLRLLLSREKPVQVLALGNADYKTILPEDAWGIFRDIWKYTYTNAGFVPGAIREAFLRSCGSNAELVPETWFSDDKVTNPAAQLTEFYVLRSVQLVAGESIQRGRGEPSWNRKVHQPLLDLACGDGIGVLDESYRLPALAHSHRVIAEDVSTACLTGDCIPRLRTEASDDESILACSVTTSSSVNTSTSGNSAQNHHSDAQVFRDGHTHSRFGSKKVDFALVISPAQGTALHEAVQRALDCLGAQALAATHTNNPAPSQSINPTAYAPLLRDPIAVMIETKTVTASKDPLVQLGFMVAALHRRLATLRGPNQLAPLRPLPTIPVISVIDHVWTMYFAVDRRTCIVR